MDAMEYHSVEPENVLDNTLANKWISKLSLSQQNKAKILYNSKNWKRGEFLNALLSNGK
jgi:hypothetical protein